MAIYITSATMEDSMEVPLKIKKKIELPYILQFYSEHLPKVNSHNIMKIYAPYVHWSIFWNSKAMEATYEFTN